ncbi:protein FAM178B [Grus japonensis]|uniref:Protein FAM178B n=1 Tax=Grus japonensis TaxID=30415 RepID=A0ABC9XS72_GRUJA
MAPHPEGLRWYQIPLSSARVPRSGLFSYGFQAGLQRYQQLRALKRLRVGRPVAPPPPGLLEPWPPVSPPANSPTRASHRPWGTGGARDSEDDDLIPLKDMLLAGDEPPSPADHQQVACPQLDPLANSLDSLVREKREQSQAGMLHAGVAWVHVDDASPCESPDEDAQLAKEQRDFLARFTVKPKFIPAVHPGENIFCARPAPAPTLDTHGLEPQSTSERFFLCDSPACQAAFVRDGGLSLLYRCLPTCPLPVLRWLFQLMTLCPDTTNASQALWEIWLSTGGEPWCPTVQEITQAFARLGADLSPLCRRRLLPPELCPTGERSPDPSCPPRQASPDATSMLALVTQLGDICKFLALCVVIQPCRYTDGARLSLVTLLSFLGLDWALRCQPLPELQHLLHCLLEGIRDWWEQLQALGRLLVLAQPDTLRRLVLTGKELKDADWETCYLSYSLLLLASNVVGTEQPSAEHRGHLQQLCAQLDRHFGRGLREGTRLLFRTQLKGLATLLYVKWQEMLA